MLATFPVQGQAFDFIQARGIGTVQTQRRACGVFVQVQLAQGTHYRLYPAVGQGDAQRRGVQAPAVEVDQQVFVVAAPGQFAGAQ
ncbi:hypothetical protein D3C76_1650820 [compost metagenome]